MIRDADATWRARAPLVAAVMLYALIALVAVLADVIRAFNLSPLIIEGILATLLVVLGLFLAWVYFVEPAPPLKPGE